METAKRIVILSDTHLGKAQAGPRSARALFPLLDGADRVILNGDTAELHDPHHRAAAAREVMALRDHCEAIGAQLTLIAGNHDPFISQLRSLRLFGGQVMLTHGDVLHPAIAPWSHEAAELKAMYDAALSAARAEAGTWQTDEELQLEASRYASHRHWSEATHMPTGLPRHPRDLLRFVGVSAKVMYYWMKIPDSAFRYCAFHAPNCRYFVFGHIHRSGVWQRDGRVVINTGAFERPGKPRGVVIEQGVLRVMPIRCSKGSWQWVDRAVFEGGIDTPAGSAAIAA